MGDGGGEGAKQPFWFKCYAYPFRRGVSIHMGSPQKCFVHHRYNILFRHLKPFSETKNQVIPRSRMPTTHGSSLPLTRTAARAANPYASASLCSTPSMRSVLKWVDASKKRLSRSQSPPAKLPEPSQCQSHHENEEGTPYNFPYCCS